MLITAHARNDVDYLHDGTNFRYHTSRNLRRAAAAWDVPSRLPFVPSLDETAGKASFANNSTLTPAAGGEVNNSTALLFIHASNK
jgi:hypothetical protein